MEQKMIAFIDGDEEGAALRALHSEDLADAGLSAVYWELGHDTAILGARKMIAEQANRIKELEEAIERVCNGVEQTSNDYILSANMRATVASLRAILNK